MTSETGTRLLADLRAEITRADHKASVLAGAIGLVISGIGGLLAAGDWSPDALPVPAAVAWWTGTAAMVWAVFAMLLAVMPRGRTSGWRPGEPLTYFGDIRQAADAGLLGSALARTEQDPREALLSSLTDASEIANRKHLWIQIGLSAFGAGSLLLLGAALLA